MPIKALTALQGMPIKALTAPQGILVPAVLDAALGHGPTEVHG